jgi:dUTP pyrophosphatase
MYDFYRNFKVKKLKADAILPTKAIDDDAGYDLYCYEGVTIQPQELAIISTQVALDLTELALEPGTIARGDVKGRSSAVKKGLLIQGEIDQSYTGEIRIQAWNIGKNPVMVNRGDRIAQIVLGPAYKTQAKEIYELPLTKRSDKGFGSSGK